MEGKDQKPPEENRNKGRLSRPNLPQNGSRDNCRDSKKKEGDKGQSQPCQGRTRPGSDGSVGGSPLDHEGDSRENQPHGPPLGDREGFVSSQVAIESHDHRTERENEDKRNGIEDGCRPEEDPLIASDSNQGQNEKPGPVGRRYSPEEREKEGQKQDNSGRPSEPENQVSLGIDDPERPSDRAGRARPLLQDPSDERESSEPEIFTFSAERHSPAR